MTKSNETLTLDYLLCVPIPPPPFPTKNKMKRSSRFWKALRIIFNCSWMFATFTKENRHLPRGHSTLIKRQAKILWKNMQWQLYGIFGLNLFNEKERALEKVLESAKIHYSNWCSLKFLY